MFLFYLVIGALSIFDWW